jgi:anthranilate synthase component I
MFQFTPSQIEELKQQGSHVLLKSDVLLDAETPISLYYKLCEDKPYSFLFESAEQDARMGRYSFIGFDPIEILEGTSQNPLDAIRKAMSRYDVVGLDEDRFEGGFVGYFSYEAIRHFEKIPVPDKESTSRIPESVFFLPRVLIVFDHIKHVVRFHYLMDLEEENLDMANDVLNQVLEVLNAKTAVPVLEMNGESYDETALSVFPTEQDYKEQVRVAKEKIEAGDIFQVVLSQSMEMETEKSAFELYRRLRHANPSPYMYFVQCEGFTVVGASPETMVRLERGDVLVRPIAGTRPRGKDEVEDVKLERDLLVDPKEIAEHRMLVDLGRNDVGQVSIPGSVRVPHQMFVQRFSSVMHMVSDVVGKVREDQDMFDVFQACFPAGTLSGAPKIRACEIIAELEGRQRGIYGGAVGYFGFSQSMDFAIAIRTMIHREGRVYLQAGAGVVYDSVPLNEYQECFHKAKSCLAIL